MDIPSVKISIIFPTFNAENFINRNLRSIQNLSKDFNIEVVIIDNNSTDNTLNLVRSFKSKEIKIIKNRQNFGFARACNIGAKSATGEFLFITNQDVVFPSNFFHKCIIVYQKLNDESSDVVLSPAVVFPDKNINYYGGKVHYTGLSFTPEMYNKLSSKKKTFKTYKASGCSMFLKKQTFLDLNGFDPCFFMYKEDVDFSLRALRRGIPIYTTNKCYLYHLKEHYYINDFVYYFLERNRFILIFKHIAHLFKLLPYFIILELVLIFQSITEHKFTLRLKVYKFVMNNLKELLIMRNEPNNKILPRFEKHHLSPQLSPILLGRLRTNSFFRYFLRILNLILK
ncbi:MAG: glycosyltransferase family 2 protein [Promethearchaeati archaeon]